MPVSDKEYDTGLPPEGADDEAPEPLTPGLADSDVFIEPLRVERAGLDADGEPTPGLLPVVL